MSTTTQRLFTKETVRNIMNKRTLVPQTSVNKKVVLTIQGDGNVIDVKNKAGELVESITDPGVVLQKRIFNVQAASGLAMGNARNRQFMIDAIAAEKAGDLEKADQLYREYLNATQLSFSVILPSLMADKLANGVDIAGKVELISTENGSLLTIDPSTISVVAPEVLGNTSFSIDDFFTEEDEETPAEKAARLKAEAKAAKLATK